jgi:hypothetical protein
MHRLRNHFVKNAQLLGESSSKTVLAMQPSPPRRGELSAERMAVIEASSRKVFGHVVPNSRSGRSYRKILMNKCAGPTFEHWWKDTQEPAKYRMDLERREEKREAAKNTARYKKQQAAAEAKAKQKAKKKK